MAARNPTDGARPGDILVVVHEFQARSPDELSLARGDRVELIERDDDFGDGWFLGRNTENGDNGLFPEVYTRPAPKPTITAALHQRMPSHPSAETRPLLPEYQTNHPASPFESPAADVQHANATAAESHPNPLQFSNVTSQGTPANRASFGNAGPRSISMTLSGEAPREDDTIGSPVMHETLSVIDEHITDMSTPRHSIVSKDLRGNDSGSEYSSHHRLSYINGQETEDEENNLHTEAEVTSWSPERVAEYLEDVGVEKKHCEIFKEQEINGEVLLGMDQATIFLKEFELGPVGPRLRTWLKIKALQQEVKTVRDAPKAVTPSLDGSEDPAADPVRNRATSMGAVLPRIPSLREGQGAKASARQTMPRANSTAGHSTPPAPIFEGASPLMHGTSIPPLPGTPTRPSAASVRSLNHNRRHSSIDYAVNPPTPGKPTHSASTSHKKVPSFDRNWSMGSPLKPSQSTDSKRPSSSNHMHSASTETGTFDNANSVPGMSSTFVTDLDRGYFSGGEVDNRKARNVLRKKESPSHSRNPSFSTESGRRAAYNRRHSRIGSTDSNAESVSPVSPAMKAYYGSSIKSKRSSSAFDFVRPLKSTSEIAPAITKLDYGDSPSIDAIANSPHVPASETSSQGRASPSPAAAQSHSFFGKKSRSTGLRAISDAITGTERAQVNAGDMTSSPIKELPVQSPTRTGSSTPSGTSVSKSFDFENPEINKRLTSGSTSTSGRRKSKKHGTSAYTRGRETITPQEAMVGCDYSGWMKKKSSSLMTTWKTRLFVLRGRRLSYFYTEYDTEEKGLIDISSHRVLPANNERITGFHATITRASSTPTSPQNATIPTAASTDSANNVVEEDVSGMFIFKLVPPRAGLQKGVQFTKPIVHYFAVDSLQLGRLWMAALMKATIDRDDSLSVTTTYQQKTISLEKARAMRQRPPALMDDEEDEGASSGKKSKESIQEDVIPEEDEKGLAISGLDDAKALLDYAENGEVPPTPKSPVSPVVHPQVCLIAFKPFYILFSPLIGKVEGA
ncbi:polarized growth protein-like protein Boi2 [Lophiostoma macrostomum CBS 122681]|uniref:Polarized growth protein-like protein Boi2 n=1 Tax=Lophiostoma macrostomum CBS 122681 TaxID=1314788 RepID=A0A6A6TSG3_9PLEO|nr:polarized growth protein-like protein Boi2 [Lophiostoma macrostomum CBS 122681]